MTETSIPPDTQKDETDYDNNYYYYYYSLLAYSPVNRSGSSQGFSQIEISYTSNKKSQKKGKKRKKPKKERKRNQNKKETNKQKTPTVIYLLSILKREKKYGSRN